MRRWVVLVGGGGSTWHGLEPDTAALASKLHSRVEAHQALEYDEVWAAFLHTDARDDGTVWDIYSDPGDGLPAYSYTLLDDQCGEYDSEGDCYNREHSFPQSWSDDTVPERSDLHHVFPVDGWVNGVRGRLPLGPVAVPEASTSNGSTSGDSALCDYGGEVFEPVDAYKGDLARALLYMSVRYRGEDEDWGYSDASDGASLEPWFEQTLLAWHLLDPVSAKEQERNDAIEALQGNRNPFVDRPELACGVGDF